MKKHLYYASFVSGMQYIIKDILEKQILDIKIHQLFDGMVLFETIKTYDKLNMYCFNNIFSVIHYSRNIKDNIEAYINEVVNSKMQNEIISNNTKKYKTFRIITSSKNKLVSINNGLKVKLESLVSLQSKLKLSRSKSDAEFWIVHRTEGFCYFLKRLSKHTVYEKILNKGELHPEIAFLMNWFSEINKNDILLDPFCGNGSISLKRILHFPVKYVYAFDIDRKMIEIVNNKISRRKSLSNLNNISVKQIDIKDLNNELPNESIDKIVTDPPWGLYENTKMDIEKFYIMIFDKMEKVLKNSGIIVLLIGRNIDIEIIIKEYTNLTILQKYDVLISGKKANIVKIKKI